MAEDEGEGSEEHESDAESGADKEEVLKKPSEFPSCR